LYNKIFRTYISTARIFARSTVSGSMLVVRCPVSVGCWCCSPFGE